ncbi:MAG: DUF2232 domain-containing protein [Alphaproteobacteria bacterium]|nr:DUF2232 domain-containing protein [Alphaproteobacteria bacterium]
MPREALIGIGAGLASAVASLAFVAGVPFALTLVYLSPLPLMAAGLALGPRVTVIGAGAGLVATGLGGGVASMLIFGAIQAFPAMLVVFMALLRRESTDPQGGQSAVTWYPVGHIVAHLGMLGGLLLILTALFTANPGLSSLILNHLGEAFEMMAPQLPEKGRQRFADMLTPLFPGAVAASWVIMTVVNSVMAQGLVVRMKNGIRPRPQYSAIDLPHWLSWPLVVAAAVALAGSGEWKYVGRNAVMVFATPYFLLGLAVVHSLARRVSYTGPLLVVFYLVIVVSLWATLVVAGIGVVEQWYGLRGRTQTLPSQTGDDRDN